MWLGNVISVSRVSLDSMYNVCFNQYCFSCNANIKIFFKMKFYVLNLLVKCM